jgi:hypothetical protein
VNLQTQFGAEPGVAVGPGTLLCAPALKNGAGDLGAPHLRCHQIAGPAVNDDIAIVTQFVTEHQIIIGAPQQLCVPASQQIINPPGPPAGPVPPGPYYKCYAAPGSFNPPDVVNVQTKFGLENGVNVNLGSLYCAPTLKNGSGTLNVPALRCHDTAGGVLPAFIIRLFTQFFAPEVPDQPLGPAKTLCVPATKVQGVGGVAELSGSDEPTPLETSNDSSGPGSGVIAGIAGGAFVLALAFGAVAYYGRRRLTR